ncbi:helix-turn-helix transcriptional regulator [Dehalobacter sp. DCM]|uniref:helix-turn-helix domain-containing protein n=1 Tax=Dehalobacter sp. DCM TaxID=2907827 RepID=UPI003081418F|nr:helix-turn-helix transcriptional regulator [Dehalobacter sp. DCM]
MSSPLNGGFCTLDKNDFLVESGIQPDSCDIQDNRVLILDKDLNTVNYTPDFLRFFYDPEHIHKSLFGKSILFYAPNFEELGEIDRFRKVARYGGSFNIDCYETITEEIKPVYDRMCVFSNNELVYIVHTDITEQVKNDHRLSSQAEYIRHLEKCCSELKVTINTMMSLTAAQNSSLQNVFYCNIEQMLFPLLDALRNTNLNSHQLGILDVISENLSTMMDPFVKMINTESNLTKKELQIANLVRQGKTTKEIAALLILSPRTVDFHRANIRKKLDIKNLKNDLQKHLVQLGINNNYKSTFRLT